ncbi:MAG TPA: PAS domain-containing protein [Longimicrobiaceae bacterium]|jgi:PAS domain S-box-containing protein
MSASMRRDPLDVPRAGPAGGREPLEIVAPGRPLPHMLHALCRYLESASADWERREAELRRSEAFLAQAQRLTRTGSLWWKPSTGEIAWSDGNYRLMGYPVGITPTVEMAMERCHPDDLPRVQETLAAAVRDGAGAEFEHRLLMPDGSVKHVRVVFQSVGTPGDPEFIGAATDITEWKRAEEGLRRSEAYLAEAQRLSSTGNFGWSAGGGRHVWSDETFRIFGLDRSAPVTRRAILERVHPEELDTVRELIARAEEGQDVDQEFRLLLPDGETRHVHVVAHGVRDRDGRLEVVGAIRDVTGERRSEEALGGLRSELARVAGVAGLGALAASIAHEVGQPLSGVVTSASTCLRMLAREPADVEGARRTARRAIRDADRAAGVIAGVRALLAGRPPAAEPVDLNAATREVAALSRGELQRGRAALRLELAGDLPPVAGDRVQLQQVVSNLLRNAVEAMGGVEDRPRQVVVRTALGEDGSVCLSVKDSGVGFEPGEAGRLFDAFYTTKPDGMGIGLAVSRSIVESHGGRLRAAPNDGPGATFAFSLPPFPGTAG